jgi:hypothetical protein
MNDPKRIPPDFDRLPSLGELVKHEQRGAPADQGAAIAKKALDVPALPGAREMNEREAYRQRLIAGVRANEGRVVNGAARGGLWGALFGFLGSILVILVGSAGKRRRK